MAYRAPFIDPREHYRRYRAEFDHALLDTVAKGDLILRDQLRAFETNLASYVGVGHAVGVNSGYHALHLSMLAAGIGPGDEVITVAHTFVATISAIVHCGATPVLVTTSDPAIARTVTLLRFNGEDRDTGEYHYHGYTALLDNIQAAVLDVKLRHLNDWIGHRRRMSARYCDGLQGVGDLGLPHWDDPRFADVCQNYVIRTPRRDALRAHLTKNGVETLLHWPKPVWEHKALDLGTWHLPNTEAICREVLSLPLSAETTDEHVDVTVEEIKRFFGKS